MNFYDKFESYNIPLHGVRLPEFTINDEIRKKYNIKSTASNYDFLRTLCVEGFKKLKISKKSPDFIKYGERVKYELDILKDLSFVDYILIVWLVVNFCKEKDIPLGRGRGSAASSLILFLIGVTGIDPIKYGLYFERFISKIRAKKTVVDSIIYLDGSLLCDVDLDICYYRRNEVIDFLNKEFEGKTCKICTYNSLQGKLLIKECGKVIADKSESEMNEVAELIPKMFGVITDIEEAYEGKTDENSQIIEKPVEEFRDWCGNNREVYEIALKLRGLIKNKSVHASALLLSYEKIADSIPTELSSTKEIVSSYSMDFATLINLKLDLLGLRSVSIVHDVCKSLDINPNDINVEDETIYQNLQDLKTPHGLFQIEAPTSYKACRKIKPKNLSELSGLMAIARPGALQFLDKYANFTNNGVKDNVHEFFDDILSETGGNCLYQESLMKMLNKIGFSLDESETCRKIVGKKQVEKVKQWKQKIFDKVKENNLDESIGEEVWKILNESASYSFNKCIFEEELVELKSGKNISLDKVIKGDKIKALNISGKQINFVEVIDIIKGNEDLYEIELQNGKIIKTSIKHKFLCQDYQMRKLEDILKFGFEIISE